MAKKLSLKDKIEIWWFLGDQHKAEKILTISLAIVMIYIIVQAFLGDITW